MAFWYHWRGAEEGDAQERWVAERLGRLDDRWIIRWGYLYQTGSDQPQREGDFLIHGPDGRVLVMEVKSGRLRNFVLTGRWEHADENPWEQLAAEHGAVLRRLREEAGTNPSPWVEKALCLPQVALLGQEPFLGDIRREEVITARDLEDFPAWWKRSLPHRRNPLPDSRGLFLRAWAREMRPAALDLFIRESDRLLLQFQRSEFELLEITRANRQLLVEGGPGTGKTFLALAKARQLAEEGPGRRVLFLCFNLALGALLREMAGKLRLARGEVTVRTWQEVAEEWLARSEIPFQPPAESEAKVRYFNQEIPGLLLLSLEDRPPQPEWDALVVDEAQDHDTAFPPEIGGQDLPGWWHFYLAMLRQGREAPMAVFYDPAQRPGFRDRRLFDPDTLRRTFSQPAHLRLTRALRYTRPIFQFLTRLQGPGTAALLAGLEPHPGLPEGPDVVVRSAPRAEAARVVGEIARAWIRAGLCREHEIVILGKHRLLSSSSLGPETEVGGMVVREYEPGHRNLRYLGIHRAKGLDFLAVILIDLGSFADLPEEWQAALFLGASRARQLLAVVEETP